MQGFGAPSTAGAARLPVEAENKLQNDVSGGAEEGPPALARTQHVGAAGQAGSGRLGRPARLLTHARVCAGERGVP